MPHPPRPRTPALLVVVAAVLWGTSGTAQELGPPGVTPQAVAGLRSLFGGLLLVAVVVVGLGRAAITAVWRRARGSVLLGATAMACFQLGYFGGIRLTGVAVGTLVAIGSAPVTAGLLDLLRGRPPGARWAVATAVVLVGTALLVMPGAETSVRPAGVALSLLAGASYATYAVASKGMLDAGCDPTAAMAGAFIGAALLLLPLLATVDLGWAVTGRGVAVLTWLSVVTIALGYMAFARGLRGLEAARATTLTLAEPLTAALLAVALLGERLSGPALGGAVLVGVGLVAAAQGRHDPRRA